MEESSEIENAIMMIESSTREQKRLRSACLRREEYRCPFTGTLDVDSVSKKEVTLAVGEEQAHLFCAHILPFGLGSFNESNAQEVSTNLFQVFAL